MSLDATGTGAGAVLNLDAGDSNAIVLRIATSASNPAIDIQSPNALAAHLYGNGVELSIVNPNTGDVIKLVPSGSGKAINAQGQILVAPTNTDDDAVKLVPNGAGLPIHPTSADITAIQDAVNTFLDAAISSRMAASDSESYAADGAPPTNAQLLYMILALLGNFKFDGVTQHVYGLDKTTEVMTYAIDDTQTPTEHQRQA
jgi:hypothetical protein